MQLEFVKTDKNEKLDDRYFVSYIENPNLDGDYHSRDTEPEFVNDYPYRSKYPVVHYVMPALSQTYDCTENHYCKLDTYII